MKMLKSSSPNAALGVSLITVCFGTFGLSAPGCGADVKSDAALPSTETGNPPVIDEARIRVELVDGDVHVIGRPGAVSPGGVDLTIRNKQNDSEVTVTSNDDGSFDVVVSGKPSDDYEVSSKGIEAVTVSASSMAEPMGSDAAATPAKPTCSSVCERIENACGPSPKPCIDECTEDQNNAMSCGQSDEWQALLDCCTEATYAADCGGEFDACQREACGQLRPSGAADGCMGQDRCVDAEREVDLAVEALLKVADRSCDTEKDCVPGGIEADCFSGCNLTPISRKALANLNSELTEQAACKDFIAIPCKLSNGGCPPIHVQLACVDGMCVEAP